MGDGRMWRGTRRAGTAALIVGLLGMAVGCHAKMPGTNIGFAEPMAQRGQFDSAEASAKKVADAGEAIAGACAKEPYANAHEGLVVTETGLHEDVFELRDRVSYKSLAYGQWEAQRLEALLRKEAGAAGSPSYPAEQAECIRQFADHMQTLTDPLVEADAEQKQLDVSAFNDASKEAQQETDEEEKAIEPSDAGQRR